MGLWKFTPLGGARGPVRRAGRSSDRAGYRLHLAEVYACTRSGRQKTLTKGNNLLAAVEFNVKEKNGLFDEEGALENAP